MREILKQRGFTPCCWEVPDLVSAGNIMAVSLQSEGCSLVAEGEGFTSGEAWRQA